MWELREGYSYVIDRAGRGHYKQEGAKGWARESDAQAWVPDFPPEPEVTEPEVTEAPDTGGVFDGGFDGGDAFDGGDITGDVFDGGDVGDAGDESVFEPTSGELWDNLSDKVVKDKWDELEREGLTGKPLDEWTPEQREGFVDFMDNLQKLDLWDAWRDFYDEFGTPLL